MKLLIVLLSYCALIQGGVVPQFDDRIIGGTETTIEEHPYQISLRYLESHHCGGSIINEDTILTASHCTNGYSHPYFSVRVGATVHSDGEELKIKEIIEHPEFNSGASYNNDVAIIKLQEPLKFSPQVQPISLQPKNTPVAQGTKAVVSGWGTTKEGESTKPDTLLEVDLKVISLEACREDFSGKFTITEKMLCAKIPGHDACQGDSGGPLVADGKLIGVVSWGIGCANPSYAGVYANVASLHDFIDEYL